MSDPRAEAFGAIQEQIQRKLEVAFWPLDDLVFALSPDTPAGILEAWAALHKLMTPEFIANRNKLRGVGE